MLHIILLTFSEQSFSSVGWRMSGQGTLFLYPLVLLAVQVIPTTYSRKSNFNTRTRGIHISGKIRKTVKQNEVSLPVWTKERKGSHSQVKVRKSQRLINRFLQGHLEIVGPQGVQQEESFDGTLPPCHTSFISVKLNMLSDYVKFPFLKEIFFLSESLSTGNGEVKKKTTSS